LFVTVDTDHVADEVGTNKKCARETVDALVDDALSGQLAAPRHSRQHLDRLLDQRVPHRIGAPGWNTIDQFERDTGRKLGRTRVKLTNLDALFRVAH